MSRLCQKPIPEIKNTMIETAKEYAKAANSICVLKDACTVTASPEGMVYLNLSGNDGMSTAGSGDVLSGILAAMLCMYRNEDAPPTRAEQAALGVFLHGTCGDIAAKKTGKHSMTARDIIWALTEGLERKEESL